MFDCVAVGVYRSYSDVETAVGLLEKAHISREYISIVGHDKQLQEAMLGHFTPPDYVEQGVQHTSERNGTLIGGLAGLFVGSATLLLPGIGLLAVLGPLAGLIGGMAVGGLSGDVAGQINFADIAADYRDWLKAGNYLVFVQCSGAEDPQVRSVLEGLPTLSVTSRPLSLSAS
jgi:hypothetical protein